MTMARYQSTTATYRCKQLIILTPVLDTEREKVNRKARLIVATSRLR